MSTVPRTDENRLLGAVRTVLRGFPVSDREDFVHRALAVLGQAARVGRVYVFENAVGAGGEATTSQRFEWCAEGVEPQIDNPELQDLPWIESGMGRWLQTLRDGRSIAGPIDEFPDEEQEILRAQGILSLAVVPIWVDGELWGFVGFDDVETRRVWSESEQSALFAAGCAVGQEISRKRAEDRLLVTQRLETLGRLSGALAHDFNNLLVVILGYGELLRDRIGSSDDPQAQHAVGQILDAAGRSADITRQLLDFARARVLEPRVLDLHQVLRRFERLLKPLLGRAIELELRLAPEPAPIELDLGQLEQVLANLASNARDAMPGGGRLVLATEVDRPTERREGGGRVRLTVHDSGVGMEPEVLERAFEPFFTTKPPGRGTGLGLASVLGIVTGVGGTVDVRSAPERGTTFTIELPRASADPVDLPGLPESVDPPTGGETILVVENEDDVREITVTVLEGCGYRAVSCEGLRDVEAFLAGERTPIDLLMTDVLLDDGSGRDVDAAVREVYPECPVLYVSGFVDASRFELTSREGAGFLSKPWTPSQLATKVRAFLDARA